MGRDLHREIIQGLALHRRAEPAHRLLVVPGQRHIVPVSLVRLIQDIDLVVHASSLRTAPGVRVLGVTHALDRGRGERVTRATFIAGPLSAPDTKKPAHDMMVVAGFTSCSLQPGVTKQRWTSEGGK